MTKANRIPILLMRLLALGATVSATVVMVTSHETTQVLNVTFKAKFTNSPTFVYFMIINAISSCYSLLVLVIPSQYLLWRLVLVLDLLVTTLLISSISAGLGVAQVGKNGNTHAGWLPICGQVPKFCDHVTGALAAGFIAAIIYFLLLLYNVLNLLTLKG